MEHEEKGMTAVMSEQETAATMTVPSSEATGQRVQFYITMPDEMQNVLSEAMSCYSEMKQVMDGDTYRDMSSESCERYRRLVAAHMTGEKVLSDFVAAREKAGHDEARISEESAALRSKLEGITLVVERAGMAIEKTYGISPENI